MTFARVFDLYVDVAAAGGPNPLLQGLNGSPLTALISWVQGDCFTLRIHFRLVAAGFGAATTAIAVDDGDEIVLAAKVNASDAALVFSASGFEKVVSGSDIYYQASLDLNTVELAAALTGASLVVLVDLELQNNDNTRRLTFRFATTIIAQAYDGEGDPTPAAPAYPSPAALVTKEPTGANYRFKDGQFQLWNPVTGMFHAPFPNGPEGAVTTAWGAGVS